MSLFRELNRRNVFRVGIAYAVTAWVVIEVADVVLDTLEAPLWVMKAIMLVLALGFLPAVVFAWAFELTPEGLKKQSEVDRAESITHVTARKLDYIIIVLLVVALGTYAWDRFHSAPVAPEVSVPISRSEALPGDGAQGKLELAPKETSSAGGTGTSIAVLPFVNLSADPEQEYFSDGISEELLNVLAKYPDLRVAARTSSFQFKGESRDITDIARQLNVNHVLEGSVRKSGTRLRITAQLIDAASGFHLWSETYDRELDDVFAIQDDISAAIGEALRVELALAQHLPTGVPRVAATDNTAAYEAFLQGRHLINQRGGRNVLAAVEHLERCVRLDPDFAPCHAWLAIGHILLLAGPGTYGDLTLAEVQQRAIPHIEAALELDPNLAEAYGARTLLAINSGDYRSGLDNAARALELNPVYVDALNWRGIAAMNLGRHDESLTNARQILEIDPLSIIGRLNFVSRAIVSSPEEARRVAESLIESNAWAGYTAMGTVTFVPSGDLSGALEWFLKAYRIQSRDEFSNQYIMEFLSYVGEFDEARRISSRSTYLVDLKQGRFEDAIETLRRELNADPANLYVMSRLAEALHLAGRIEEAAKYYERLREKSPSDLLFEGFGLSALPQVRMAYDLRRLGDAAAAEAALDGFYRDLQERREAGVVTYFDHLAEALAAAMNGDESAALESIRAAISSGLRSMAELNQPIFASLADHQEMLALKAELQALLDVEHAEILQLICHNNPAFDTWQPRRETCENVPQPH
jgi:TolB-like protein